MGTIVDSAGRKGINAVIKLGAGKAFEFNLDYCKGCSICVSECPCGAIEMVSED